MTPSIEEVKNVCKQCGMFPPSNFTALQAFAQHYIEVGRNMQRESDAALFDCDPSMENYSFIAPAIRNNTGE